MADGTPQEDRLLKPPDTIYRRITPGNWSLHRGELIVRPSHKQFDPHRQDGLLSVGVHSLILDEKLTPEAAMLWGIGKGFGLVSIDLEVVYNAGLTLYLDPKPRPPDGEGPWHANVHGIPLAATAPDKERRRNLQNLLQEKAVWVKPTHDELKNMEFEKWLGKINERQVVIPPASAINDWKDLIAAARTARPTRAQEFIDVARRAIDELST